MPTLPSCVADGHELEEVLSDFFWLIAPGIDPSTVLTQDQIDCHFSAMEQINAAFEAQIALQGKYVTWRSSPVWYDDVSSSVRDYPKAESLSDPGIDCDVDAWNSAYETTPHFRYRGSGGKGLKTYYCISSTPPPPPVDPPDDGPASCGEWGLLITRPVQIPINTPTWVDYQITGTFPPEVTSDFEIQTMFDGSQDLVESGGGSGVLEIDSAGNRVKVILTDNEYHHLDIFATQVDCDDTIGFDTEMLRASTEQTVQCQEQLTSTAIRVCDPGVYKAVITVCGQDFTSNNLTVGSGTELLPLPIFILHPQTQIVSIGSDVVLTSVAKYAESYQWQLFNGAAWINISGETSPNLLLEDITLAESGRYRVVATNTAGSVSSNEARLTIADPSDCPVHIVLRCDSDRSCHGIIADKVGPGNDSVDFVLDWFSTTALCCNPVVVRADDGTDWELFMTKVGSVGDSSDYVIDWRSATAVYSGQRTMLYGSTGRCLALKMNHVGSGSTKDDYVLDWEFL